MVSYNETLDYFEDQIRKMKKERKAATQAGNSADERRIADAIEHTVNALSSLRKMVGHSITHPIPWDEIVSRKGKPVYIREQKKDSDEWFGWWDIIDDVSSEWVRTSYSEEMLRSTKGLNWDMFDVEIKRDEE